MADTTFTDDSGSGLDGTIIVASWLNDVNDLVYTTFNGLTSPGAAGTILVSDGTNYVEESGATARTSLGLGTSDSPTFTGLTLSGTSPDLGTVTTINIDGGTIDGAVIGGTTPAAITGTTLTATGAFTSLGIDDNATGEVLQLADTIIHMAPSTGVLIGDLTTSPDGTLHIHTASAGTVTANSDADDLVVETNGSGGISILSPDANVGIIRFGSPTTNSAANMQYDHNGQILYLVSAEGSGQIVLQSAAGEAARIDASGNFLVGKATSDGGSTQGLEVLSSGTGYFTATSGNTLSLNRLVTDGSIVSIKLAGAEQGSISGSGTTISYNGGHLGRTTQLSKSDPTKRHEIPRGTLMASINEKCEWADAWKDAWEMQKDGRVLKIKKRISVDVLHKDAVVQPNEQKVKVKISDIDADTGIYGIMDICRDKPYDCDESNDPKKDFTVAATGDFVCRVTGPCLKDDLLVSNGDGTARVLTNAEKTTWSAYDLMQRVFAKCNFSHPAIPAGQENPQLVEIQLNV